jgi:hypothetical protein
VEPLGSSRAAFPACFRRASALCNPGLTVYIWIKTYAHFKHN